MKTKHAKDLLRHQPSDTVQRLGKKAGAADLLIHWLIRTSTGICFLFHLRTAATYTLGMKIKEENHFSHNPKYHFIDLCNSRVRSQSALSYPCVSAYVYVEHFSREHKPLSWFRSTLPLLMKLLKHNSSANAILPQLQPSESHLTKFPKQFGCLSQQGCQYLSFWKCLNEFWRSKRK